MAQKRTLSHLTAIRHGIKKLYVQRLETQILLTTSNEPTAGGVPSLSMVVVTMKKVNHMEQALLPLLG